MGIFAQPPKKVVVRKNSVLAACGTSSCEDTAYHPSLVLEEGDRLSQRLRPCHAHPLYLH
jgi:hypothetical protein